VTQRVPVLLFWLALIFALVMATLPHPPPIPNNPNDKFQHITAFAVLTGLAAWAYPRLRLTTILLGLALFGGLIELIQSIPALHRDSDFLDWLADLAAVAVVLVVAAELRTRPTREASGAKQKAGKERSLDVALASLFALAIVATGAALTWRIDQQKAAAAVAAQEVASVTRPQAREALENELASQSGPQAPAASQPTAPVEVAPRRATTATAADSAPFAAQALVQKPASPASAPASLPSQARLRDRASGPASGATSQLTLPVFIDGKPDGTLRLSVDKTSLIYADIAQLKELLPKKAALLNTLGTGYVSFIDLRQAGIDLTYDHQEHRVEIASN